MLKRTINKKACENYLLMISIRKVALWNQNVKTTLQESLGEDSLSLNRVIPRIAESVSPQPSRRRCRINMPPLLSEKPRIEIRGHFFQAKFDWNSVKIKKLGLSLLYTCFCLAKASVYSILFHVLSGSYFVIAFAISSVFGPRSFSNTIPS